MFNFQFHHFTATVVLICSFAGEVLVPHSRPVHARQKAQRVISLQNSRNMSALNALLATHLQSMADEARQGRRIGGYVLFGTGGALATGGVATFIFGDQNDRTLGWSLLGAGVLVGGLGIVPLSIPAEQERLFQEYQDMPVETASQQEAKFYYGDRRFESLAVKKKRQRLVGGISTILGALTAYGLDPKSEEFPGLLLIGAAGQLFIRTEVETRYRSYQRAKQQVTGNSNQADIDLNIFPLPGNGLGASVQLTF